MTSRYAHFSHLNNLSDFMEQRQQPQEVSTPVVSRSGAKHLAKRAARQLHRFAVRVLRKVKAELQSTSQSDDSISVPPEKLFAFQPNDILLVFGAHWDKPHYTAVLKDQKESVGITIAHLIHDLIPVFDRGHVAEVEHTRFPKYMREISRLADIIYLTSQASVRDYTLFLEQERIESPKIQLVRLRKFHCK